MSKELFRPGRFSATTIRWAVVMAGCAVVLLTALACRTVSRGVVVLPEYPGANYIGSKECEMCHEEIYREFQTADHARLMTAGPNALSAGCEACHGPGSAHSESGGEIKPPFSFTSGRPSASGPATAGVPATHSLEEACRRCHVDVRAEFNLPHHHPVPEGRMSCIECHPPHRSIARTGGSVNLMAAEETCLECHAAQRGPYVFEHEAMREGCTACHTPHGSINAKMLTARDSNLCMKCHFQQVQNGAILIGGSDHTVRLQQGTCWTAGCHEAVHGSRVNSSLRF